MKKVFVSPLRYPGGKRRLARYIAEFLNANSLKPSLFVEPFAGGASVAISLLASDRVDRIALADRDPLVAAFWKVVFSPDADWLVEQIRSISVDLDNWKYFRLGKFRSRKEKALACLFLNRTSFSGILNASAGPIGGWSQKSKYTIDCRFPRERLIQRILSLKGISDRVVFVRTTDYKKTISYCQSISNTYGDAFFYFDPPFYNNANRLYRFSFGCYEHTQLRDELSSLPNKWILSYDWHPEIQNLYAFSESCKTEVDIYYTAGSLRSGREIILTNLYGVPTSCQMTMGAKRLRGLAVIAHHQKKGTFPQSNSRTHISIDDSEYHSRTTGR